MTDTIGDRVDVNKEVTDRTVDTLTTTNNETIEDNDISNGEKNLHPFSNVEQITNVVPIIEEKFDVTKKTIDDEITLEQRWITTTKKIEVPLRYQELFINGKELDSYDGIHVGDMLSKIKEKIKGGTHSDDENNDIKSSTKHDIKYYKGDSINEKKSLTAGRSVAINAEQGNQELEKIIPIWGEELVISKRMVKLGELVVKKYRITEDKTIDVDIIREKLTLKHPDGRKEEVTREE